MHAADDEDRLADGEGFLARDVGGILGISRKDSIPLLESLDSVNSTRRIGDRRVGHAAAVRE